MTALFTDPIVVDIVSAPFCSSTEGTVRYCDASLESPVELEREADDGHLIALWGEK